MTKDIDEKLLDQYIQGLDKKEIKTPAALDDRIKQRIESTSIKPQRLQSVGTILVASMILMMLFIFSVKISPSFAAYASNLPVLKIAVDWLQGDSGTEHAKEQGYAEIEGIIIEENGYVLDFDNIMFDEDRLVMTVAVFGENVNTTSDAHTWLELTYMDFVETGGFSQVSFNHEGDALIEQKAEKIFHEDEITDYLATNPQYINMEATLMTGGPQTETKVIHQFESIKIPIEAEKILRSKRYPMDNTITLEEMSLTLQEFMVSPTRMRVDASFDIEEGYSIAEFENPHLRDAQGNIYKAEGLVSSHITPLERSLYFVPSIYFDDPHEEMYFSFDGIWILVEEDKTFTLNLNDNYPKTMDYMGEEIVIEKVSYSEGVSESLAIQIRMPDNIRIDSLIVDGVHSARVWSSSLDEDGKPRPQYYGLDVEYRSEYEVQFAYSGRLMESKQEIRIELE